MSNRLAIDPSEIKISDPAEIRRRLWAKPSKPCKDSATAPVVKAVEVDFGFDTPVEPRKTAALTAMSSQKIKQEALRKQQKAETIRQNEERIDAWIEQYAHMIGCAGSAPTIIRAVAKKYGLQVAEVVGRDKGRKFVLPRQEAIYQVRAKFPHLSLPQIGEIFGSRDHSTIAHSIRAHARRNNLPIPQSNYTAIYCPQHVADKGAEAGGPATVVGSL